MIHFANLPSEILIRIIECLCPHCTHGAVVCEQYTKCLDSRHPWQKRQWDSHAGLLNLAASSKRFRRLTEPIAYHVAVVGGPSSSPTPTDVPERWMLYLQTLLRRPDLAREVRELHLDSWNDDDYDEGLSGQLASLIRVNLLGLAHLADICVVMDIIDNTTRYEMKRRLPMSDPDRDWPGEEISTYGGAYMRALLLSLVPNLQRILLTGYNCELWPRGPTELPCLEEIAFQAPIGGEYARLALQEYSPTLFSTCSLKRVFIGYADYLDGLSHPGVTELHLHKSCLGASQFWHLFGALPSLKRLSYHIDRDRASDHPSVASPGDIAVALSTTGLELEHLSLDFGSLFTGPERPRVPLISNLRSMVSLVSLEMDGIIVSKRKLFEDREGLGIFPATLRRLVIRGRAKCFRPKKVAYMIRKQRFPQLSELRFERRGGQDCREERWLPVLAACKEKGVKFSIGDGLVTDRSPQTEAHIESC